MLGRKSISSVLRPLGDGGRRRREADEVAVVDSMGLEDDNDVEDEVGRLSGPLIDDPLDPLLPRLRVDADEPGREAADPGRLDVVGCALFLIITRW